MIKCNEKTIAIDLNLCEGGLFTWAQLAAIDVQEGALKEEQRSLRAVGCSGNYPSRSSLLRDAAETVEDWDELLPEEHALVLADMQANPACKRMPCGECFGSILF